MKIKTGSTKHSDHRKLRKLYRKAWEVEKRWNKRTKPECFNETAEFYKTCYKLLKNSPGKFNAYRLF